MTGTDRVAVAQEGAFSSRVALQTKMMISDDEGRPLWNGQVQSSQAVVQLKEVMQFLRLLFSPGCPTKNADDHDGNPPQFPPPHTSSLPASSAGGHGVVQLRPHARVVDVYLLRIRGDDRSDARPQR